MNDFKPGSLALVIGCVREGRPYNGTIVRLVSRYYYQGGISDPAGHAWYVDGPSVAHYEKNLLPLPPDDEAKRLFRETEKPVAA